MLVYPNKKDVPEIVPRLSRTHHHRPHNKAARRSCHTYQPEKHCQRRAIQIRIRHQQANQQQPQAGDASSLHEITKLRSKWHKSIDPVTHEMIVDEDPARHQHQHSRSTCKASHSQTFTKPASLRDQHLRPKHQYQRDGQRQLIRKPQHPDQKLVT